MLVGDKKKAILNFAPEPVLSIRLKGWTNLVDVTTDLFLPMWIFQKRILKKLTFASDRFDVVLCNHVIEHVPMMKMLLMKWKEF